MKLDAISIKNFRCFDELTISLHPEMTVLIAPNGSGKTAILDAARIAVWPFVKAFDLGSQNGKSPAIQIEDVRLIKHAKSMEPKIPAVIRATGTWENSSVNQWQQEREKLRRGPYTVGDQQTRALTKLGSKLQKQVWDNQPVDLPLIVYLGTGRLLPQERFLTKASDKKLDSSVHSRLWGYHNCLTAVSSYKQFEEWYIWICKCFREQQLAQLEDSLLTFDQKEYDKFKSAMTVVQEAVNLLTKDATGWHNLRYVEGLQQLAMEHPEHGILPLPRLSDGLRNMIVLISNIAFRCIKLNPHFDDEAAKKTAGIVMIDEVDMFLHPSWQQRVLGSLREAFPKIQFIVTTHSPQVLTTVSKENVRILHIDEHDQSADMPEFSPLAHESGDALAQLMGTQREPELPIQKQVDTYEQYVRAGKEESQDAKQLFKELQEKGYQFHESDLETWRFLAQHRQKGQ